MRLIGEHMCMPGIPRQTWLKLANGASHPPVLFVHDLPANDAEHRLTKTQQDGHRLAMRLHPCIVGIELHIWTVASRASLLVTKFGMGPRRVHSSTLLPWAQRAM
jgi:hypothetical protein